MVLKRRTTQNIVWGGLAGCFPALIGWTAVTGELAWPPVVLFLVVFFWTPPHTWALAMRYREDYASVDVPMLPVLAGGRGGPPDRRLLLGDGGDVPGAVAGRGHRCRLSGRRTRLGAAFLVEVHLMWLRARRSDALSEDQTDAAVPLVEPVPVAAVRGSRAGPAAQALTRQAMLLDCGA